ncbi:MAG: hypothetical protein CSA95_00275 [Bacteroidetes bacterium]|nr:MAG: hypothetical protein CSA95_00275 [Bacteroidota bacterium]PIE88620.1 MAG: hypothetical protein CSA04_00960 [Bacteroidota bacterium]
MEEKKELLRKIMTALAQGDKEQADKLIHIFMEHVPEITTEEVTQVAQELDDAGVFADVDQHVSIEQHIFGVIDAKIPVVDLSEFPKGHPVHTFLMENKVIRGFCKRAEELLNDHKSFETLYTDWVLVSKQFMQLHTHYLRKENQLFPFLERRGFSHPSTIMWSIHDTIRALAKRLAQAVESKDKDQSYVLLRKLQQNTFEMTIKEERVLLPKSSKLLTKDDWLSIRQGEDEIGWIIPPPKVWNSKIGMDNYLKSDAERIEVILNIIHQFFKGVPIKELQQEFDEKLNGSITPVEFALAEQKMEDLGVENAAFEAHIDELISIFKRSLEEVKIDQLEEGHPLDTFIKENEAIKQLIAKLREANEKIDRQNIDHDFWQDVYDKLWQINTHYLRKENQLFPYLEAKGFDKPSTVMWALHDEVRDLIKQHRHWLDEKNYQELFDRQTVIFDAVEGMIFKEEKILWPTSLELLSVEEWFDIRQGEDEVGYCLIATPPMWNPHWRHPSQMGQDQGGPQTSNMQPHPKPFNPEESTPTKVGGINLEVGTMTPEQINLIFKYLPFDVTYVDEFDEVCYYNKGDDRVFPRSPGIIGRRVKYCHPPKSVHVVEKIIAAFKKGERSEANFWINFNDKFVYIQYFAVRDNAGNYRGVLEITQDATAVRNLQGEQRLLDWE